MSASTNIANSNCSFFHFIWKERANRNFLIAVVIGSYLQFIIFKICYPYPDFFSDSYSYIYAAYANLDVAIWPIGYSKFLRWFHFITHSDTALIGTQYFLIQLSAIYFFFTLLYFYRLRKNSKTILEIFLFLNPLPLYLSNYVNSDALFAALSLFWFTNLLWIIHWPKPLRIFSNAIILFLAFCVRNNAYYYPLIGALAFALAKQSKMVKFAGIIMPLFLIVPFILHTRAAAKALTGKPKFSIFTGWQIANNVLYMYGKVEIDSTLFRSQGARELNRISAAYFKPMTSPFYDYLYHYPANFFIVQRDAPLKVYFDTHYNNMSLKASTKSWGQASTVFEEFGTTVLKKHPLGYVRYFMLNNTRNFFDPKLEKLGLYNLGNDFVYPMAAIWFDYPTLRIVSISKSIQTLALIVNPMLVPLANICFITALFYYTFTKKYNGVSRATNQALIIVASLWFLNFAFSVFATIIIFRYHIFPFTITFCFSILLIDLFTRKVSDQATRISVNSGTQTHLTNTNL